MTATPHGSYRQRASEGVQSGDCIYAIKFFLKCHETLAIDTDFFSLGGTVELGLLIMSARWINEKEVVKKRGEKLFVFCHVFISVFYYLNKLVRKCVFLCVFVSHLDT